MATDKKWEMKLHDDFEAEFKQFDANVRDELLAAAKAVEIAGPKAGRPHVDTLKGSEHDNMKELRFKASNGSQIWRAAFAFDTAQKGVILVAADKQGTDETRFYKKLIEKADKRFDEHLAKLKAEKAAKGREAKSGKSDKSKE